jgi:hypothetical protein
MLAMYQLHPQVAPAHGTHGLCFAHFRRKLASSGQFKVGLSFLPSSMTDVLIDRRVAIA